MAGEIYSTTNLNYYLYTGQVYWTMSPYNYNGDTKYASIFSVGSSGELGVKTVEEDQYGMRPVINLKTNTEFKFEGTGEKKV